MIRVVHGDCLREMKKMETDSIDVCITDPPYNVGIDFGGGRKKDQRGRRGYVRWLGLRMKEAARVARHGIVYFPGKRMFWTVQDVLAIARLEPDWQLLGWHKREFCGDVFARGRPGMSWEPVVWAPKKRYVNLAGWGATKRDFLAVDSHRQETGAVGFPTVKPTEVISWLVGMFCPPGGTVLDPFAGSGTTGVVCARVGRGAVLIEVRKKNVDIIEGRLALESPLFKSRATLQHEIFSADEAAPAGAWLDPKTSILPSANNSFAKAQVTVSDAYKPEVRP